MSTEYFDFDGAVDAIDGWGQQYTISFSDGWVVDDRWTFYFSATRGDYELGASYASDIVATFAMTLDDRVYLCSGSTLYHSGNAEPTGFNLHNTQSGFIEMVNYYSAPEDLQALAAYQGRMAVFSRHTTQIWAISATAAEFTQIQVLPNIGTIAPLSVQSLGELDVLFLSDSGIRSLRVKDSSLNAYVVDIGSPVDKTVTDLVFSNFSTAQAACGVVEPNAGRYWLAIGTTIYVLSYYPSAKISAWSTYLATYEVGGVTTEFTPEKFVVADGTVYCRTTTGKVLKYSTSYDKCVATVETPWLDMKTPSTVKLATSVDVAVTGAWKLMASMDTLASPTQFAEPVEGTSYGTFDELSFPYEAVGTHVKFKAESSAVAAAATLGMLELHYNEGNTR